MAKVVPLGQFGAPRKSALSGVSDAISTGLQIKNLRNKASATLAKANVDQSNKDRNFAMDTVKQLSLKTSGMEPEKLELFEQSDQYKQLVKGVIKPFLPDFVGKDGKVTYMASSDIYTDKLKKMKADLAESVLSGKPLSEGQKRLQVFFENNSAQSIGQAIGLASSTTDWISMDEKQKSAAVSKQLQFIRNQQENRFSANLAPGSDPNANAGSGADPNDRLGILGDGGL